MQKQQRRQQERRRGRNPAAAIIMLFVVLHERVHSSHFTPLQRILNLYAIQYFATNSTQELLHLNKIELHSFTFVST